MTPLLDANVIIRYLTGDHPEQSRRATKLFSHAVERGQTFRVVPHIVCEVVYVLEGKFYNFSPSEVSDALHKFSDLACVKLDSVDQVRAALIWHARHNVDFADALLAALAESSPVYTFNLKHFNRLPSNAVPPPPDCDT